MEGVIQEVIGTKVDTGRKDSLGNIIYKKIVAVASFPNAGAANTAHGTSLVATKRAMVKRIFATDGTTIHGISATLYASLTATNIAITATGNLSTFAGHVEIEFCE